MLNFDRTGRGAGAETSATAAVYRRVAARLLPFLLLCYIVAMIDRLNVGYAKLQFMADLNFDEAVFGMAAGSLYVGYILFEVPSNLMLERVGLKLTLLRIMTLWGVFVMAMAFATSQWGFYAIRFMIGAGEAGFFPGVLFYLTGTVTLPREERDISRPLGMSDRCDRGPPRGHRRSAKRAVRLG